MVAPTTRIRSKKNTTSASRPAKGAPRIVSTMKARTPAIVACSGAADVIADGVGDPAQGALDALGVLGPLGLDEGVHPPGST